MQELFSDVAIAWLAEKRRTVKANTFRQTYADTVRLYLMPEFGERALSTINKMELVDFFNGYSYCFSESTLKRIRLCLYGIFEYAIDKGLPLVNPTRGIKVKSFVEKRHRIPYTEDESDLIFSYASTHKYGLGVCILLKLGLRCSEMLGLQWRDIDFRSGYIHIQRASVNVNYAAFVSAPKSKESIRTIPVPKDLLVLLAEQHCGSDYNYIVCSPSGKPYCTCQYTRERYDRFFRDAVAELGVPRLSPHMLRHTCGTLLYARCGDIYAVSKFLGHASVEVTTKYYVHSSPQLLKQRLLIE